jgi:ribosomal protein L14
MLLRGSLLLSSDNSGALTARLIRVMSRSKYRKGRLGDVVLVTLKKINANRKVSKGELHRALIMNVRFPFFRADSTMLVKFLVNSCILLKKDDLIPLATRVFIIAVVEFAHTTFKRLLTIAVLRI